MHAFLRLTKASQWL